jgi:hypothetical protein
MDGVRGVSVIRVTSSIILPILMTLLALLCGPYVVCRGILPYYRFGAMAEQKFWRLVYPTSMLALVGAQCFAIVCRYVSHIVIPLLPKTLSAFASIWTCACCFQMVHELV